MNKSSKISILGNGLVGMNVYDNLVNSGYTSVALVTRKDIDFTDKSGTEYYFDNHPTEYVFNCAAKVGGIGGNDKFSADFISQNLQIQTNVILACTKFKIKKLLFLGSSCIYPKNANIPINENEFLNGYLEETNRAYAVAKIAGITMCQMFNKQYGTNYISVMPTNLYGRYDTYDIESGHMLPTLVKKFHDAKQSQQDKVILWGTGNPKRECLYAEELAGALEFLMVNYNSSDIINVGTGADYSIFQIATVIKNVVGFEGEIVFDKTKPDGTYRKLLDSSKINSLGWKSQVDLQEGIEKTYEYFLEGKIRK